MSKIIERCAGIDIGNPRNNVALSGGVPALRVASRHFRPHKLKEHISEDMFYRTYPWLHTLLWETPERSLHRLACYGEEADGGEATRS